MWSGIRPTVAAQGGHSEGIDLSKGIRPQMVETALADNGASLEWDYGSSSGSWKGLGSCHRDELGEFDIPVGGGCGKCFFGEVTTSFLTVEYGKVFGDGEGMGTGCELGHADVIGDEALVGRYPGVEFT